MKLKLIRLKCQLSETWSEFRHEIIDIESEKPITDAMADLEKDIEIQNKIGRTEKSHISFFTSNIIVREMRFFFSSSFSITVIFQ